MKTKLIQILFFLIVTTCFTSLYAQVNYSLLFEKKVKNSLSKFSGVRNLNQAKDFFLLKNWDSTLVHSMRQISLENRNSEISNFCHFFRGISFKKKEFLMKQKIIS